MGKDATTEGAPFVVKTYQLVSDESTNDYVTWSETEDSFVVLKPVEFASDILPRFFKHNNFCSFIRQLNTYGFHKVETKQWEFKHEFFIRGQPELLKQIARRKSKKRESSPPPDERHTQQNNLSPPPSRPSTKEPINVVTPPSSLPTPTMTPTHTNNVSPPPLFSSPNLQLPSEPYQEVDEVDQLRDMNNKLIAEISRLNEQQETTQLTIKQILNELIESRKVQQNLEQKVNILARELQLKTIHDSTEPIKQDLKPRQVKQPFAFAPMQPVQNYPVEATPGVEFTPNPTDLDYLQVLIENPDMESALNSILAQNGYPTDVTASSSSSMNGHNGKVAYVTQPY